MNWSECGMIVDEFSLVTRLFMADCSSDLASYYDPWWLSQVLCPDKTYQILRVDLNLQPSPLPLCHPTVTLHYRCIRSIDTNLR